MDKTQVFNMDCMIGMKEFPDKHFDLAIIDCPYGIGEDGKSNHSRGKLAQTTKFIPKNWDLEPPNEQYFWELSRVSKNLIIWGANHFLDRIPFLLDSSCWIVWDKVNGETDFADCELAWTSFNTAVRKFTFRWQGMLQGNMSTKEVRIHPTQKPVKLYQWLLKNYAKEGDKILDSHVGSGSSRIAAYDGGFEYVGYELDTDYFNAQEKRFAQHKAQLKLFA